MFVILSCQPWHTLVVTYNNMCDITFMGPDLTLLGVLDQQPNAFLFFVFSVFVAAKAGCFMFDILTEAELFGGRAQPCFCQMKVV